MRIGWLTDIHLDFLEAGAIDTFFRNVASLSLDAVLLGGDIGDARSVIALLERMDDLLQIPLYYVLGNHDYYFGSIAEVRAAAVQLGQQRSRLHYLTAGDVFPLRKNWALVGHDGWADGREGDYARSYIMMNDYKLIRELAPFPKMDRWSRLKQLGDEAAEHVRRVLPAALADHDQVLLLTHVPPTRCSCWYDGKISDDEWAPHFVCQAVGQAILDVMRTCPQRRLTVLCGHTHGQGISRPLDNVTIYTGSAQYGAPAVQQVLELD